MSNYTIEPTASEATNVAALYVRACSSFHERTSTAAEACERFLRSAALLPENGYLGWQIESGAGGTPAVFAFTGAGVKATPDDFAWIFERCAAVAGGGRGLPGDPWAAPRWAYGLEPAETGRAGGELPARRERLYLDDDYDEGRVPEKYFRDLFEEIEKAGAIMRILACADGSGGQGMIVISLPEEMTLRLRTMLSLAFYHTSVKQIKAPHGPAGNTVRLPARCLSEGMQGLLSALMLERSDRERENGAPEGGDSGPADLPLLPDEWHGGGTGSTPIEELGLSLRSYNCLKRAGVNSVEQLRALTDDDLCRIRNLGRKSRDEVRQKLTETVFPVAPAHLTGPDYAGMLGELIGLKNVKEQVRRIVAFAKLKHDLAARERETIPVVLNMEFVGNPGTAKTTVARIMAGILHEAGLLSGNDLVEVGRADLVARYEGQTADKVRSVFRQARGKLLFIDEAYSLVENFEGEFGDEAINTIVQEMENDREDTIVIFAGYPQKMAGFFARNPGLRSRVPFRISFDDYSAGELAQIAELEIKKRGFSLDPEAKEKIASVCGQAAGHPETGNGRFCRNLAENAILSYAARAYADNAAESVQDFVLRAEDFSPPTVAPETRKTSPIGFRAISGDAASA